MPYVLSRLIYNVSGKGEMGGAEEAWARLIPRPRPGARAPGLQSARAPGPADAPRCPGPLPEERRGAGPSRPPAPLVWMDSRCSF